VDDRIGLLNQIDHLRQGRVNVMVIPRHGAISTQSHSGRVGIDLFDPASIAAAVGNRHADDAMARVLAAMERARPKWQRTAPCKSAPALFTSGRPKDRAAAFTMCAGCAHRDPCLSFAIDLEDFTTVIYGGTDGAARRLIAKQRAKETTP
jgi:hypothetical protein